MCYPSNYMRKVVSAILLLGMVWGDTLAATQWPCVYEVYGSPYGFSYVVHPEVPYTAIFTTVPGRSYAFELPVISNPVPLSGQAPISLRGSTIVRGQYDFDNFERRYREMATYNVGRLYIALLHRLGALIAHTKKEAAQEFFTLMVLNRRSWHEIPLDHLALYTASQLVTALPSLADFFAIERQNGVNREKTEKEFFRMVLDALDKLRPQLLGGFDPLEHVLARIKDQDRFQIVHQDRSLIIEEDVELFEFDAMATLTESEPLEFAVTVEKHRASHLWDNTRAPFLLLETAQYDDYLDLFRHQSGLIVHVSGLRTLIPSQLIAETEFDDPEADYFYASSAIAIELTPRQVGLFLDFVRQFRNFGLELIPI